MSNTLSRGVWQCVYGGDNNVITNNQGGIMRMQSINEMVGTFKKRDDDMT